MARIVIIDNDESIREFMTLVLADEGLETFSYAYRHIDLSLLQQIDPDLIILDFQGSDGQSGWRLLQLLKMGALTAHIPILIMTTAFQLSSDIRAYLLARNIQIAYKPFDVSRLLNLVRWTLTPTLQSDLLVSGAQSLPILLVDDSEELLDITATLLRLEGYQVAVAMNGQEALDSLRTADYSLILLDIDMPIMNGFEFLEIYSRQLKPFSPVIIISAESNLLTHIFPSFVVDVLAKPFEIDRLSGAVKKYAQPA